VLQNGHTETVKVYLEAVLASELSSKDKKELIASIRSPDGVPGLYVALYNGHTETVKVYLDAVLASELELKDKKELITSVRSSNKAPGLYAALQNGHTETVNAYLEAVLASGLRPEDKKELIASIRSSDGVSWSWLYRALNNGHTETGAKLSEDILLTKALHLACQKGDQALYQYFLDHHFHIRKNPDLQGNSPLMLALMNHHYDIASFILDESIRVESPLIPLTKNKQGLSVWLSP
jgi:ankyrin repeat protein